MVLLAYTRIMHPLRPNRLSRHVLGRTGPIDRLTDWLLGHCPFTTLATLTMIVAGSSLNLSRPAMVFIPVILADLTINLVRLVRGHRKPGRGGHSSFGGHLPA